MTNTLTHLQGLSLHPAAVAALVVAAAALVIYEPIVGKRGFARFRAAEAAEGEPARLRFYRSWVRHGYLMATLAILLVLALPGTTLADIGFRLPDLTDLNPFSAEPRSVGASLAAGALTGFCISVAAYYLGFWLRKRRAPRTPIGSWAPKAPAAIASMLPTTPAGRRGWAALSLSAGISEEITYRGFLLLTLVVVMPAQTPTLVVVLLAAAMFGAAHWYQGRLGILTTGLIGMAFAFVYLASGSLLVPMILHILIDLRALLAPVATPNAATPTATAAA